MGKPSKEDRKKYLVDYHGDTEFSASARLPQSKWRDKMGFEPLKFENLLDIEFAKASKANFLTKNIQQLVTDEVPKAKKIGALICEPKIWNNLLSSQPLCFNLFGELYYDLDLATRFFHQLFETQVEKVTAIKFEYSPGRSNTKYIGDHSAFDVFVEYSRGDKRGFIGIEVKYAESLKKETKEKAKKNFKEQYEALTNNCGVFKPDSVNALKKPPLSQIWRDHLLSIATKQDYDEGFFVFLFPSMNSQCQTGVNDYQKYLVNDNKDESLTGFYPRHLDDFILTLRKIDQADWTEELVKRYLGE